MSELESFLRSHGLWALFFAAAFEGDLTLLLSGMLVHLGVWPPLEALAIGSAGALAGDSFYFWLGHRAARRWLNSRRGQRILPRIERAVERYGVWSLFLCRYIYGARAATMLFWGTQRLSYGGFIALDALNCLLWASVFSGLGYLFSSSLEPVIGEIRRLEWWLLLGLLGFAALLGLRYGLATKPYLRRGRQARRE